MMKRDKVVFENEKFEVTGYDIWMTAREIAELFGVTIMKVRGAIRKVSRDLAVNFLLLTRYELLENGYKDDQFSLECIIAISYYIHTGLSCEFRHWICDRITKRKERAMIVYF